MAAKLKYTEEDLRNAIIDMNKVLTPDPELDNDKDMDMDDLIKSFGEGAEMVAPGDKLDKKTIALAGLLKVTLELEEKKEKEEKKPAAKKDTKKDEKKPAAKKDAKKAPAKKDEKKDEKKKTEKKVSSSDGLTEYIQGLLDRNMKEDTIVKKAKEKYPEKSYRILGNRVYAIQKQSK